MIELIPFKEWVKDGAEKNKLLLSLFGTKERAGKKIPTFRGEEISDFGIEHGQVDLACFVQGMNRVLCNGIAEVDEDFIFNHVCGQRYTDGYGNYFVNEEGFHEDDDCDPDEVNEDEEQVGQRDHIDFYQYYVVDDAAAELLKRIGETICESEALGVYVWCVPHAGTPWTGVLTGIKIPEQFKVSE